jgi:membrane protein involved in colicin uptake
MKIKIRILDLNTNEVQDIEREMNADELAQWEADKAKAKAEAEAKAEVEADKAALLDRLGITEDEAKLLLS